MADPFSFNLDTVQLPRASLGNVDNEAAQMASFFRQQLLLEKQMREQQEKQLKAENEVKLSANFGSKVTNFDDHVKGLIGQREAAIGRALNDNERGLIIKQEYASLGKDLRSNKLNRQYSSDYSTILLDDVIKSNKLPKAPSEQSSGLLGGLGDIGLSLGQGIAGSVKSLTDLAGAGNVVSESLDSVSKWLQENKTEASKAERKQINDAIKKAEASGSTKEEVFAYLNAFKEQPLEMLAQGIGSFATLGAGKAAQAAKLANLTGKGVDAAQAATKAAELGRNVNIGIGTAQGVGAVKGSQYEVTFNEAKKAGLSDEQAAAIADDAQSYSAENAGRQLLGGALGLIATTTGPIEKAILGKAVEKQGNTLARITKGVLTEAGTEAAQEGQTAEAGNVAAINAGLLDPSQQFRGVAGSAAQAAAVGGILGGGADILTPGAQQAAPPVQPNGPITPDPVAPTSARQAADWRNQISQGQVPAEIQAWSQQNQIPVEEAIQIHQQALGAPSANPGQILAAANGAPTKFFQGVDLETISQVEVPIGDGSQALTGPELVNQINEAIGIVTNAQSRPKTSYQGYVNEDAVTEVTNAKEFLKSVQKSVTANPQILTQAKQVFEARKQDAVKGTVASRGSTANAGATVTAPTGNAIERITAELGGEPPLANASPAIANTAEGLTTPPAPVERQRISQTDLSSLLTGSDVNENLLLLARGVDQLTPEQIAEYETQIQNAKEGRATVIGELTPDEVAGYERQIAMAKYLTRPTPEPGGPNLPVGEFTTTQDLDAARRQLRDDAAEAMVAEMESLFGVEMTNQMIDSALAQLGGGANFQQQIEAIRNEFNRQLEESTEPTSGGGQPSENAPEGGATGGTPTVAENEAVAQQGEVNANEIPSTAQVPVGNGPEGSTQDGGENPQEATPESQAQEVTPVAEETPVTVEQGTDTQEVVQEEAPTTAIESQELPSTPIGDATTVEVDGVTRPALNSSGKPIHPTTEGVRNFWRWFGDSKVVDEEGRPLVVYHGTYVQPERKGLVMGDIRSFDRMITTKFRKPSIDTVGSWFSTNPGEGGAEIYSGADAGSVIYPAHLSIKNPQETTFQLMTSRARKLQNGKDDGRQIGTAEVDAYRNWLNSMGKDGIKITGSGNEGSTEFDNQVAWIALEPEQIKSSTGNSGLFDPTDSDITDTSSTEMSAVIQTLTEAGKLTATCWK